MVSRRRFDPDVVERVVEHFDYLPASQVRQILERYDHELWLQAIAKNPAIQALVALKPGGKGIPWDRAQKRRDAGVYLQSCDINRARALLRDPKATWILYHAPQRLSAGDDSDIMVRRLR